MIIRNPSRKQASYDFSEYITNNHKNKKICNSIWKQFSEKGITVKKGSIHDATFIVSDPDRGKRKKGDGTMQFDQEFSGKTPEQENGISTKRFERERIKKEREDECRNVKTRRSKDGHGQLRTGRHILGTSCIPDSVWRMT